MGARRNPQVLRLSGLSYEVKFFDIKTLLATTRAAFANSLILNEWPFALPARTWHKSLFINTLPVSIFR